MKPLFITAIGTGIGKTIVSAIITEKLKADYWKPIQSGDLENSDTQRVQNLLSNPISVCHPERFRLTQPFSPHKSAALDGVDIQLEDFQIPETSNTLVIEGAGGLMVPLNSQHYVVDLIRQFDVEVILVIKHYLGSINHSLMSLELLKNRNISLKGIIFNGDIDLYSEQAILDYTVTPVLGRFEFVKEVNQKIILDLGKNLDLNNNH